jgi:hypothetical protein
VEATGVTDATGPPGQHQPQEAGREEGAMADKRITPKTPKGTGRTVEDRAVERKSLKKLSRKKVSKKKH